MRKNAKADQATSGTKKSSSEPNTKTSTADKTTTSRRTATAKGTASRKTTKKATTGQAVSFAESSKSTASSPSSDAAPGAAKGSSKEGSSPVSCTTPPSGALVWTSGDWTKKPASEPPYNGIRLTALPEYSDGKLASISVMICDFAESSEGVPINVVMPPVPDVKTPVPPPSVDGSGSFSSESPSSTVSGDLMLRPGVGGAQPVFYLFVNLVYGLPNEEHHAEGGILEIPQVQSSSDAETSHPGSTSPGDAPSADKSTSKAAPISSPSSSGSASSVATPSASEMQEAVDTLKGIHTVLRKIADSLEKLTVQNV